MTSKPNQKTCFVIMPITDPQGYSDGHFARVYQHIIRPACVAAGYTPIRADEVKAANYIVLDVLNRILASDMVVCDLSARNPNVLYELGIRQAFDRPSVLVKDKSTDRIFDIQGLRTLDYDETLRVDTVARDVDNLKSAIESTSKPEAHDVNSLVRLLGIANAKVPPKGEISAETALIVSTLKELGTRIETLETRLPQRGGFGGYGAKVKAAQRKIYLLPDGDLGYVGDTLYFRKERIGELVAATENGLVVENNGAQFLLSKDDSRYPQITSERVADHP